MRAELEKAKREIQTYREEVKTLREELTAANTRTKRGGTERRRVIAEDDCSPPTSPVREGNNSGPAGGKTMPTAAAMEDVPTESDNTGAEAPQTHA